MKQFPFYETRVPQAQAFACCGSVGREFCGTWVTLGDKSECKLCHEVFTLVMGERYPEWWPEWKVKKEKSNQEGEQNGRQKKE